MEATSISTTVLVASDGYKLTQSADVDILKRSISKKVYLASTDSADNWKEITDEEAEEYKTQIAAAQAALEEGEDDEMEIDPIEEVNIDIDTIGYTTEESGE